MPSKQPRLALTLPDDLHAVLFDLAHETGKPASKVVTELLQEMLPQLQGLLKFTRAAKRGNQSAAKTALRHMVGDTLAELMVQQQPELFKKGRK